MMQLLGNLLKLVLHIQLWIKPAARIRVANRYSAWLPAKATYIPSIVWVTHKSHDLTWAVYLNFCWNRLMAARCEVRFFADEDCLAYVKTHFPSRFADAYERLQIGAAKADLWRVLALYKEGGVYVDMDAAFCWPVSGLLRLQKREFLLKQSDQRLTNFCFASTAGNPLILAIAERIVDNIEQNQTDNVYQMTGPGVFDDITTTQTACIVDSYYFARQGVFSNKRLQYPDKLRGYWVQDQKTMSIVRPPQS